MRPGRLLIDSFVALLLGCAFACAGWLLADPLFSSVLDAAGVERVVVTDPNDPWRARLVVAIAVGLLPLWGWLAALVERLIARTDPPWSRLAWIFAVPTIGAGLGLLRAALLIAAALKATPGDQQLTPLISLRDLAAELGWTLMRWGALFGLLLTGVLAARARRGRPRDGGS